MLLQSLQMSCQHLELKHAISATNAKTPCYSLHAFVESFIAQGKEIIFKDGNNLKVIYKKINSG